MYLPHRIASSGVTDRGAKGANRLPGKLNAKTGSPIVDILIILYVVVFCVFRGVLFLASTDIHDIQ